MQEIILKIIYKRILRKKFYQFLILNDKNYNILSGFLGSVLADLLAKNNRYKVTVLDTKKKKTSFKKSNIH